MIVIDGVRSGTYTGITTRIDADRSMSVLVAENGVVIRAQNGSKVESMALTYEAANALFACFQGAYALTKEPA